MSKISFVYFDVGGVVLLDYSGTNKWVEMRRGLGLTPELDPQFDIIWNKHREQICIDYDIENLVPQLRQIGLRIPNDYSMLQDFVSRYDPNPSIWPVITYAQSKVKTGLLTNMYPRLLSTIFARQDLRVDQGWDVIVDSSVVGAQKPDPKIFEIAAKMANMMPSKILFVENSLEHVNAAKQCGWQTFLYDHTKPSKSSQDLRDFLNSNL